MLGYILSQEAVAAYYGGERRDVVEAIFRAGENRDTVLVLDSATLSRGGGDGPGFHSPEQISEIVHHHLREVDERVPRKYPSFHGTVCTYLNRGFFRRDRQPAGADMVFDIDIKTNYREAFRHGERILDFLDRHEAPYRLKFSGNTSPHIILPAEAFPQPFPPESFRHLFQVIKEKSGAAHLDDAFGSSTGHFLRLAYSLNERTGLVSVPISRDAFDRFEPAWAEWQNVTVDESWFQLPPDANERMERFLADVIGFSADAQRCIERA